MLQAVQTLVPQLFRGKSAYETTCLVCLFSPRNLIPEKTMPAESCSNMTLRETQRQGDNALRNKVQVQAHVMGQEF